MKHAPQIGAGLLVVALAATWARAPDWVPLVVLAGVGVLDIVLAVRGLDTISVWVWWLFPWYVDAAILVGIVVHTFAALGVDGLLPVVLGIIAGHLFWQDSTA
jgi:hypothetical protein